MIIEDYVSFEVAKLLKEKGFDEKCRYVWKLDKANDPQDTDGISKLCAEQLIDGSFIDNSGINKAAEDGDWFEDYHKAYLCPTLQMAMKWLREVHKIYIEIPIYSIGKPVLYRWNAFKNGRLVTDEEKPKNCNCIIKGDDNNPIVYYYKYEEACEAAIKYCLTNLI